LDSATLVAIKPYDQVGAQAEGWAKRILTFYGAHYPIEYNVPSQDAQGYYAGNGINIQSEEQLSKALTVYPNPAMNEVNFSFHALNPEDTYTLLISDVYGRSVVSFSILAEQGHLIWDASEMPKGLYFFQLRSLDRNISSGTLMLER
jgi:hypothetical protein